MNINNLLNKQNKKVLKHNKQKKKLYVYIQEKIGIIK